MHAGGAVSAHGQDDLRWKWEADLLGVSQRPRRFSPKTRSHFQALGSAQAPGNSFHLLSSARPLTLCSRLPSSLSAGQKQPPNPAHNAWLCRWGINPSAMPFPARQSREGAWLGLSTNHCQVSPAHLWGHPPAGALRSHLARGQQGSCLHVKERTGQKKKATVGTQSSMTCKGVGQDSPLCGRQRSGSALEGKKKRCN